MIYTLKRNYFDDEIKSDNMFFCEYNEITLDTKNIFSIEAYQDAENNDIYGLRINGIKYPMFNRKYIEWLVYFEETDKTKRDFLGRIYEYGYDAVAYPCISEQEQAWYNDYVDAVSDRANNEFIYIEKQQEKIIKIMKSESKQYGRHIKEKN